MWEGLKRQNVGGSYNEIIISKIKQILKNHGKQYIINVLIETIVIVFSWVQSLANLFFMSCDIIETDYHTDPTLQFTLCWQWFEKFMVHTL